MTYQEIVTDILRLPLPERLTLLQVLARSIQLELVEEVGAQGLRPVPLPGSSLERASGLFKTEGPVPSDDELQAIYVNELIGKLL